MSTIIVRKLDSNWDPCWGNGQNDYISDAEAVAQIIRQRLLLFQGEWWEDRTLGTPMFQKILGSSRSIDAVTAIVKDEILDAPYVTGVTNLSVSYSSESRSFKFSGQAQTPFGPVTIS
jgi:hypothetical protein